MTTVQDIRAGQLEWPGADMYKCGFWNEIPGFKYWPGHFLTLSKSPDSFVPQFPDL